MRFIRTRGCCIATVALLILFTGCSSSEQAGVGVPGVSAAAPSVMSRFELLKLQTEGRIPGPMPMKALKATLRYAEHHARPHLTVHRQATNVALWTSMTDYSYLLGQAPNARRTLMAIDTTANNCYDPVGVKVDASQNVYAACEYNGANVPANGPALAVYSKNGTVQNFYTTQPCSTLAVECENEAFDGGFDSNNHVFLELSAGFEENCYGSSSCVDVFMNPGFYWWNAGDQSAAPTFISIPEREVGTIYYMDVDSSGNIWFDYQGDCSYGYCGYGLGEITNPTTNPQFVAILPPGTYEYAGGVYISKGGTILNVVDQDARTISRYTLPLATNGSPFAVLGPTHTNAAGNGDPVSGGFNKLETKMAIGDSSGWLDIGNVSSNRWRGVANPNSVPGLAGAAYTPSDK